MFKSKKIHHKVFNAIADEFSKIDERCLTPDGDEPLEFTLTVKNFTKDGFEIIYNHNAFEIGDSIVNNIYETLSKKNLVTKNGKR